MTCSLTATTYMGWACNPSEAAWTKKGCTHIMKALKHVVILTRPSLNWWRWQGKNLRNQCRRNRMTDGTTSLPQCTSDQVIRRCASQHSNTNWTAQCLLYSALTIPGTSTSKGGHLLWITIADQRWWLTPGISHLKYSLDIPSWAVQALLTPSHMWPLTWYCDVLHLNPGLFSHLSSCDNTHDWLNHHQDNHQQDTS